MGAPDFVAVGHVTLDRFGDGAPRRPGGAALFAAVAAHRLGLSVGLLTSHGDDFPLDAIPPRIEVVSVPAAATTIFEHRRVSGARALRRVAAAASLGAAEVPEDWRDAALVLLAPVLDEVDPLIAATFTDGAVSAAIQGWLRAVAPDGAVVARAWESPAFLLTRSQALFLSGEDARGDRGAVIEWFQRVPVGVLTAGRAGALLFVNGERYEVRPRRAREVDPTGAGDIFAAVFLAEYHRHGDPWDAADAAACAAGLSVEGEGWSTVPDRAALDAALTDHRRQA